MNNKNCTLIKTKDLQELRILAESKKSDKIEFRYSLTYHSAQDGYMTGTVDLDKKLTSQIFRITRKILRQAEDVVFKKKEEVDEWTKRTYDIKIYRDLKKMSRRELYKYVQNMNV